MPKKLGTWIYRKRLKAIMFDYDGVLNNSMRIIRALYNEFHRRGFTKVYFKDDIEFSKFFEGNINKDMIACGMEPTEENFRKCDGIVKEFLDSADKNVPLYPGIDDLLHNLKSDGYKLGIVSNGNKEVIQAKLRRYDLEDTIDCIIGYEQVNKTKPNPEGLLKCLRELKVKPKRALYVGDMENDIKAARAAGIKVIGVTYGYCRLRRDKYEIMSKADIAVHCVEDVYKRIKNG